MKDEYYLSQAIRLAEKGLYTADPNPRVGCVLVKDDKVIGSGYHQTTGEGHAEANALAQAGAIASGSTAFVTLEPCSYHGRTPSCAQALIDAGVARVVAAMEDPHRKNAGKGFEMLRAAGIAVVTPLLADSASALNPGHIKRNLTGLPYVRLKLAMSLDGKTALSNGQSQWITGPQARADVQKLRARSSVIVTGVQTVIDDDPELRVRPKEIPVEQAALAAQRIRPVYVLDSRSRTPVESRVARRTENVIVCVQGHSSGASYGCGRLELASDSEGRVSLEALLRHLGLKDSNEVLFECGATLAGSLVAEKLCDELIVYIAPKIMGSSSRSLLNVPEIDNMGNLYHMKVVDMRMLGGDIRLTLVPKK